MRRGTLLALLSVFAAPALHAQSMRTVTMSRQLADNDEISVNVEDGMGSFTVRSVGEGLLYRMNLLTGMPSPFCNSLATSCRTLYSSVIRLVCASTGKGSVMTEN